MEKIILALLILGTLSQTEIQADQPTGAIAPAYSADCIFVQCKYGEICRNGVCRPEGNGCIDCGFSGQICVNNRCVDPPAGNC